MPGFLKRLFGIVLWKKEWQEELSEALGEAQRGLNATIVVIIARESDLYAELLFLLSFFGLGLGSLIGYFVGESSGDPRDALLFALLGFAAGSTIFSLRRLFLGRILPLVVRQRVMLKAKAHFFDHNQQIRGPMALLYVSEMEREAAFLGSPELVSGVSTRDVQENLARLTDEYNRREPLKSLRPCLVMLGDLLKRGIENVVNQGEAPFLVAASDRPTTGAPIIILKGTKDIN
jgi:hypothetical protein